MTFIDRGKCFVATSWKVLMHHTEVTASRLAPCVIVSFEPCRTPLLSHHRYCIEVSDMFSCHVEGNFTLLLVSSNKGVFVENMNDFISASAHLFIFLHFADISSVLPLETGTAGLPPEDVAGPRWSSSGARALAYS